MFGFIEWLDKFLDEKNIDLEQGFEVEGPSGVNYMAYETVVEYIKYTTPQEQAQIKDVLVKIDFVNGDPKHFFRHLAKAVAV